MSGVVVALRAVALSAFVLGVATARVVYSGERELGLSTDALRAADARAAIEHARRAAGFYAPGAPHVRVAYERLNALATAAEGLGDRDTALFAFEAVRTASIETRWLLSPHAGDRARADRAIARIQAEAPRPASARALAPQTVEREALDALTHDEGPDTFWVVVLVGGATLAAAGAGFVVTRAVTATGHLQPARAAPGLVAFAAGALGWLLALWRA